MIAVLITNHDRQQWVRTWIRILRSFQQSYLICVSDNGGNQFPEADLSINIPSVEWYCLGDVLLMNAGIRSLVNEPAIDYIVKTSADTWLFNESKLIQLILRLFYSRKDWLSSRWEREIGIATDFFIISRAYAQELFPIDYENWDPKHQTVPEAYFDILIPENKFLCWIEREPILEENRKRKMLWPELAFVTSHDYEENLGVVLERRPDLKGRIEA